MATQAKALLTDVEVNEVSMVDNAANKRKFLVTKNADGESTAADDAPPASAEPAADPAPASVEPATPAPPVEDVGQPEGDASKGDVEKRGAKMAKKRLERFAAAIAELGAVLKELQDAGDDAEATEEKVSKSAEPDPLEAKVAELTAQVAELVAKADAQAKEIATQKQTIAKQAATIAAARQAPPPNSTSPEGIAKSEKPFAWPMTFRKGSDN